MFFFCNFPCHRGVTINQTQNAKVLDRIVGCFVGAACGDALGAPFEFGPPLSKDIVLEMVGGGLFGWKPGQFTDDTEMAVSIARALYAQPKLGAYAHLDMLVEDWCIWAKQAKDVGVQTRSVLNSISAHTEQEARAKAQQFHELFGGRSGGNGGLMRAFPVALAFPEDPNGLIEMTRRSVQITHWEKDAYEAAILWNLAIRTSYIQRELNLKDQLIHLPESSRRIWEQRIIEAETKQPVDFTQSNGWVVSAFQAAWSAIHHTNSFVDAITLAIQAGGDTDTVACITGALAGSFYGYSAIPESWRFYLNGFDEIDQMGLVRLALSSQAAIYAGQQINDWPFVEHMPTTSQSFLVKHPHDEGLLLGNLAAIDMENTEKVVLCRIGKDQTIYPVHNFWLIDEPMTNNNLLFTFQDCIKTIYRLRQEGNRVLLCCQAGLSRTPAMAIAYSVLVHDIDIETAIAEVFDIIPHARPLEEFLNAITELEKVV